MKKYLSILSVVSLLLYPLATLGADYGSQTSQTQQAPPVAQTLVREGDFAIKLATELDLGKPENEAVAEDMLARAGVAPVNGWISDYPVTPEIIAQLKDSITKAADNGKLPMTSGEATKGLYYLTKQLNLPVPAGPGSSGTSPAAQSNPTVINNYYYDEGPPIVTYYPPPADYLYLYAWVPFPVFWFGFWFPGFFICHNFTTVVFVTPFVTTSTVFVSRRAIVSNRIIDPVTRTVAVIDPVVRTNTGVVQPVTALRTSDGRMFNTVTNLRRGVSMSGVSAVRKETTFGAASTKPGGFSSPAAQKSAQSIFTRNAQAMSSRRGTEVGITHGDSHSAASGAPSRAFRSPVTRGAGESAPTFAAPHSSSRSFFNSPVTRGGHGPMRWFYGNGWHGRG